MKNHNMRGAIPIPSVKPVTTLGRNAALSSSARQARRQARIDAIHKNNRINATKANKMSKFKTWLRNWILNESVEEKAESVYVSHDSNRDYEDDASLRFTITPARGGIILTVRNYDKRNDRHFYTAHVLHDDQNIADGVAQIVSMELLRGSGT